MEGVTDETLAALADDIARDDAAAAALRAAPRRSAGEAAGSGEGDGEGEDEDDEDDAVQEAPAGTGARHQRGRSSSSMLNMLLDLDLGAALSPVDGVDEEADEWVAVSAPMAGGTRGVLPPGAPPPQPSAGAMSRPSLSMLAEPADLICLNSPQK